MRVVIEGGGPQARANLNGWPRNRLKRSKGCDMDVKKRTKDSAQLSDRPKWRRAGARACQRDKEAKETIEDP